VDLIETQNRLAIVPRCSKLIFLGSIGEMPGSDPAVPEMGAEAQALEVF
jgi:hypothetical protein